MQFLAKVSVKRPVFATVLVLGITVLGLAGYFQLGMDRFPKVDFPVVSVIARLPGAAPEEVETQITDKIEEALNSLSGIEELRSISSEGVAQIYMMLALEKNLDVAVQEVRDKVNGVLTELPPDLDPARLVAGERAARLRSMTHSTPPAASAASTSGSAR